MEISMVFQGKMKGERRIKVIKGRFKGILKSSKAVSREFQRCYRKFQESVKCFSGKF